ncbi:MAG: hypothetical protein HY537_05420 [Deltaproteobacteria bacterium]|nr:hypothetical protein [Deltaproteobacteria bacterium]
MPSRVSTAQIFSHGRAHVSQARSKEMVSAEKAGSLKEINRPSEDPSGWIMAQNLKGNVAVADAIAKNASLASSTLAATENIIERLNEYVQKAHELALSVSGLNFANESIRGPALEQMKGIYDLTMQALNTKYGDRVLLSGFKSPGMAFDEQGNFLGNSTPFEVEVAPGKRMAVNINAEQAISGQGSQESVNVPVLFRRLIDGLQNADQEKVQSTLGEFAKAVDQLSTARGQIGARMSEIERSLTAHGSERITTVGHISKIEDADAIKIFSDLAKDQTVLRSAVSTTQKILSETPPDILFK